MRTFSTSALFGTAIAVCLFAFAGPSQAQSMDRKFALDAAHGGAAEVQLGKLAEQKAQNPDVKAFGQRMVHDHSQADEKLMAVAQSENMTLPTEPDQKQMSEYQKLSNLSGPEFDKAYVKAMLEDHEKDVREFQKEANSGSDPKIKQFASDTLPVLESHLDTIKSIQAKMSRGSSSM